MIHVAIAGIRGRLGRVILKHIKTRADLKVVAGIVRPGAPSIHQMERAHLGFPIVSRSELILDKADVLIDVSTAQATMHHALACVQAQCPIVVGTRGLDPNHIAELKELSHHVPLMFAPDFCVESAAVRSILPTLLGLIPDMSIDVHEIDRSRGLELAADRLAMQRRNDPLEGHDIVIAGPDQEIVLRHRTFGPDAHARGALRTVKFLVRQSAGFYTMDDLIQAGGEPVQRSLVTGSSHAPASPARASGNGG